MSIDHLFQIAVSAPNFNLDIVLKQGKRRASPFVGLGKGNSPTSYHSYD